MPLQPVYTSVQVEFKKKKYVVKITRVWRMAHNKNTTNTETLVARA